eukprot:COSAG06_NODE_483_length_15127_cov_38.842960_1_plen_124_part_00
MVQAKLRMADKLNENHPDRVYEEGDYVRLSLEHLQIPAWALSKCSKLRGKYLVGKLHHPSSQPSRCNVHLLHSRQWLVVREASHREGVIDEEVSVASHRVEDRQALQLRDRVQTPSLTTSARL